MTEQETPQEDNGQPKEVLIEHAGIGPNTQILVMPNGLVYVRMFSEIMAFSSVFEPSSALLFGQQIIDAANAAQAAIDDYQNLLNNQVGEGEVVLESDPDVIPITSRVASA